MGQDGAFPPIKLTAGSTPFGRLLREGFGAGERFTEIGLHSNVNVQADLDFLHQQRATVVPLPQIQADGMDYYTSRAIQRAGDVAFVSFDLDACASVYAPVVSAPSADGFTSRQATEAAFLAGRSAAVCLFEAVELNLVYDRDSQTARLGATIIAAYSDGRGRGK